MLQAYLNDPKLKEDVITEIKEHLEAGRIRGRYEVYIRRRGNTISCYARTLLLLDHKHYSNDRYAVFEEALGIPEWLVRLEGTVFEGMNKENAKRWPLRFSKAIPVGANLESVKWRFCAFVLARNIERVQSLVLADDIKKRIVDAIQKVLVLHEQALRTGIWDETAAHVAAHAAWSVGGIGSTVNDMVSSTLSSTIGGGSGGSRAFSGTVGGVVSKTISGGGTVSDRINSMALALASDVVSAIGRVRTLR